MKLLSMVFATAVIFSVHGADQRPNTPTENDVEKVCPCTPPQIVTEKVCPSRPKKEKPVIREHIPVYLRQVEFTFNHETAAFTERALRREAQLAERTPEKPKRLKKE